MTPAYAHEANNPSPMARAIQMPLGAAQDTPWANAIMNAYRAATKEG